MVKHHNILSADILLASPRNGRSFIEVVTMPCLFRLRFLWACFGGIRLATVAPATGSNVV